MTFLMITLLVLVGLSCYLVALSYGTARDVVVRGAGDKDLLEVLSRLRYSLALHISAIIIMTIYIGTRIA